MQTKSKPESKTEIEGEMRDCFRNLPEDANQHLLNGHTMPDKAGNNMEELIMKIYVSQEIKSIRTARKQEIKGGKEICSKDI